MFGGMFSVLLWKFGVGYPGLECYNMEISLVDKTQR